mgnify:CR=1 FL=1
MRHPFMSDRDGPCVPPPLSKHCVWNFVYGVQHTAQYRSFAAHTSTPPSVPPGPPLVLQADLVLSRLASSCRQADPHLLSELRGELLYMARVIEEPVSRGDYTALVHNGICGGMHYVS